MVSGRTGEFVGGERWIPFRVEQIVGVIADCLDGGCAYNLHRRSLTIAGFDKRGKIHVLGRPNLWNFTEVNVESEASLTSAVGVPLRMHTSTSADTGHFGGYLAVGRSAIAAMVSNADDNEFLLVNKHRSGTVVSVLKNV